jgi:hypothetical protein
MDGCADIAIILVSPLLRLLRYIPTKSIILTRHILHDEKPPCGVYSTLPLPTDCHISILYTLGENCEDFVRTSILIDSMHGCIRSYSPVDAYYCRSGFDSVLPGFQTVPIPNFFFCPIFYCVDAESDYLVYPVCRL